MIEDDIIKQIRATRAAFSERHGYDVHAMAATLRAGEAASGREVVSFPPRPVTDVSLGASSTAEELTDSQKAEVDRRVAEYRADLQVEASARLSK